MELEELRDALKIVNAREYALIEESLVSYTKWVQAGELLEE
ncbi:hypothetical protein [Bacteroides sp. MSB163]|nr:hypothetical protein [uncultured Bacteroides sp.]